MPADTWINCQSPKEARRERDSRVVSSLRLSRNGLGTGQQQRTVWKFKNASLGTPDGLDTIVVEGARSGNGIRLSGLQGAFGCMVLTYPSPIC